MRIGLDAMGGDLGPSEVVAGAIAGREFLDDGDSIVLVGDEGVISAELKKYDSASNIIVQHASETIEMGESPVGAVRSKPDSSIVRLAVLQRHGELDACISAGSTGACVAAAQMHLRRLKGVHRPGIAVIVPTPKGPIAICDVGANVDARPSHLYQYGVMTSVYLEAATGIKNPRVGLVSVGEEEGKGNELVKKTFDLLKQDKNVNFIGYIEGNDLLKGVCDVMISDGFVGNIILKLIEGFGMGFMKILVKQFMESMPDQIEQIMNAVGEIAKRYDFNEHGGAPLLGVNGIWIICHGASNSDGIKNAIRECKKVSSHKVNQHITELLSAGS
jgi:glycerol-3-phosphate acyltransferase PlsX